MWRKRDETLEGWMGFIGLVWFGLAWLGLDSNPSPFLHPPLRGVSSLQHRPTLSHIWRRGGGNFVVDGGGACVGRDGSTLEDSSPPHGWVEGALVLVQRRVNVVEKVPYYAVPAELAFLVSLRESPPCRNKEEDENVL